MAYGDGSRRARRREEMGLDDPMVGAIGDEFAPPPVIDRTVPRGTAPTGPVNTTQPVKDPTGVNAPSGVPDAPPPVAPPAGGKPRSYDYIPGAESVSFNKGGNLSGFNTNEWGEEQNTEGYDEFSYKNTFGKIASNYDPTPDSVRQLFNDPQFKANFPNAVLVDHPTDPKIQFESGDPPVDVLIKSGAGGWGWQPEGPGGGVDGGAAGGGGGTGITGADIVDTPGIDDLADGDILAKIQAALAALGRGEQPLITEAIGKEFE